MPESINIVGSAALVIKSVEATPAKLSKAFHTGLSRGLLGAVGVAQRQYLSGPRPEKLDIRTRRLLMSVTSEVQIDGPRVIGRLGSNVAYAAFHEFGFHGVVNVRAHTRVLGHVSSTGEKLPTYRVVNDRSGNAAFHQDVRPGFVRMGLSNFSGLSQVKSHTRRVDYAGRPFIAPALQETIQGTLTQINQEVKAISEGSK